MSHGESLGTYQRPLHVFKYMHLHEYMKGKSQSYGAAGVLGAGATVRDAKRTLHIGANEQDRELKPSSDRVRVLLPILLFMWRGVLPCCGVKCCGSFGRCGATTPERIVKSDTGGMTYSRAGAQEGASSRQPKFERPTQGAGVSACRRW